MAANTAADPDRPKAVTAEGLAHAMRMSGLERQGFRPGPGVLEALDALYTDMVDTAIAAGVAAAKRRQGSMLTPGDMAVHLERTVNLHVPGFEEGGGAMRPYRRVDADRLHARRAAAARRTAEMLHANGGNATPGDAAT